MIQATPRPWFDQGPDRDGEYVIVNGGANPVIVETVNHASNALDGFPDRARDNAELIVRAVNDHDELVSLLAQAVDCRKCHECPDEDWLERARSALERARGS